jgi:hypothetical protein
MNSLDIKNILEVIRLQITEVQLSLEVITDHFANIEQHHTSPVDLKPS